MERAVIHSDLKKQDIQPQILLDNYLALLDEDIKKLLLSEALQDVFCPASAERDTIESFRKMGMYYKVSKTFGNIYLSPRPRLDKLKSFYKKSAARNFWLTELWPHTRSAREQKIILPQLEWAQNFISQHLREHNLHLAEFLPSNWCFYQGAKNLWPQAKYWMVDHLFDSEITEGAVSPSDICSSTQSNTLDTAFLFESIDRSVEPYELLKKVKKMLKPGGLCFITSLISSGFEVKVLGQNSGIFIPPERMNILSFEGMNALIDNVTGFEILEFSTPGVLDIPNVIKQLDQITDTTFFKYILQKRQDIELISSFQDFLQRNRLGTFGRLVLRKI